MSLNKMIDTRTEHSRAIVNPRAHWPASLAILRVSGSMRDTVSKLTVEWNRGRHSVSSAGISKLLHEHISTLLEHVRTHRPHIRSTNNNTPAFLNLRYYCALLRHTALQQEHCESTLPHHHPRAESGSSGPLLPFIVQESQILNS